MILGFLPMGINFILAPIYTYYMVPAEYGILGTADVFSGLVGVVVSFGIRYAFSRYYFDYFQKPNLLSKLYSTSFLFTLISGLIIAVALFPFADHLFELLFNSGKFDYLTYGVWVVLINLNTVLNELNLAFYRNEEKPKLYARYALGFFLLNLLFIVLGVIILELGAAGNIWGRAFGGSIFTVASLILLIRNHGSVISTKILGRLLKYGLPLIPYGFLLIVFNKLDRLAVEQAGGLEELGVFNLSKQITGVISVFLYAIFNSVSPKLYKYLSGKSEHDTTYISKLNDLFFISSLWLIAAAIIFSSPFMLWIVEEQYLPATDYIWLLCYSYIPHLFYMLFTVPIFFSKKTRLVSYILLASILVYYLAIEGLQLSFTPVIAITIALVLAKLIQSGLAAITSFQVLSINLPINRSRALLVIIALIILATLIEMFNYNRAVLNLLHGTSIIGISLLVYYDEFKWMRRNFVSILKRSPGRTLPEQI